MGVRFLTPNAAVDELIAADSTVGVGGMHMSAAPMSLVREIVRQRVSVGRLITSPSASMQADLLIGAGLVDEIISPYVGFEHLGLAPCFRRAAESQELVISECDEGSLTHALYAGAGGIPFLACPPGIDLTDIPEVNPDFYRRTVDPFTGQQCWAIAGLRPDVALLACSEADEEGNVAFGRFPFTDRLMALAARNLVVQVEKVVPASELARRAPGETLPAFLVSAVVVIAGGCHPAGSPGHYARDEDAIASYLQAARKPSSFSAWLDEVVLSGDEEAYVAAAHAGSES